MVCLCLSASVYSVPFVSASVYLRLKPGHQRRLPLLRAAVGVQAAPVVRALARQARAQLLVLPPQVAAHAAHGRVHLGRTLRHLLKRGGDSTKRSHMVFVLAECSMRYCARSNSENVFLTQRPFVVFIVPHQFLNGTYEVSVWCEFVLLSVCSAVWPCLIFMVPLPYLPCFTLRLFVK